MQTVVGVLRGGPSCEHKISLATGSAILSNLSVERYLTHDIFIDKRGVWHLAGRPIEPYKILRQLDVVYIGLHGAYGEDGEVQKLLERYGVPYVGADSFASYLIMHKVLSKEYVQSTGLKTPRYTLIELENNPADIITEIIRTYTQPVVVKPVRGGSSIGVSLVSGYTPLYRAVVSLFANDEHGVMVEEYIRGREATVSIVEDMRGEQLYALPPTEIIVPDKKEFFSYDTKYDGSTREICPAPFSKAVSEELMQAARSAHKILGARHYSRSDFIVSPRGVYYLETNTLPGLTTESLLPKSLAAVGISMSEFLEHVISLARN